MRNLNKYLSGICFIDKTSLTLDKTQMVFLFCAQHYAATSVVRLKCNYHIPVKLSRYNEHVKINNCCNKHFCLQIYSFYLESLIIIFYIYQYFNILDFGLLNELCERGMLSFDLNKNCEQL